MSKYKTQTIKIIPQHQFTIADYNRAHAHQCIRCLILFVRNYYSREGVIT